MTRRPLLGIALVALLLVIATTACQPSLPQLTGRSAATDAVAQVEAHRPPTMTETTWEQRFSAYAHYIAVLNFAAAVQYQKLLAFAEAVDVAKHPVVPAPAHGYAVWDRLAQCESSGDWADTAGSFEGGIQFSHETWVARGGRRYAEHAYDATRLQQIAIGEIDLAAAGPGEWPHCSYVAGMR